MNCSMIAFFCLMLVMLVDFGDECCCNHSHIRKHNSGWSLENHGLLKLFFFILSLFSFMGATAIWVLEDDKPMKLVRVCFCANGSARSCVFRLMLSMSFWPPRLQNKWKKRQRSEPLHTVSSFYSGRYHILHTLFKCHNAIPWQLVTHFLFLELAQGAK